MKLKASHLVALILWSLVIFGQNGNVPPAPKPPAPPAPESRTRPVPAPNQPGPFARSRNVRIKSDTQTREGVLTHYRGHVEMTTEAVILRADEVDFNSDTQQADVRGNVSVQVLPVVPKVTPLSGLK